MKNIPIPVITFLVVQLGGAIWWGAQIDHKVKLVEENRIDKRTCWSISMDSKKEWSEN